MKLDKSTCPDFSTTIALVVVDPVAMNSKNAISNVFAPGGIQTLWTGCPRVLGGEA